MEVGSTTPHWGGYGGGGVGRGGGVHHSEAEYGRAIHCNAPDPGGRRGGEAEDRIVGFKKVVGTEGVQL